MPFTVETTGLPGVIKIIPHIFHDARGFFLETFKSSDFARHGLPTEFVQDNYSFSKKGVLRGLHYQLPPSAQGKLVSCLHGEIYDVAVDLRRSSKTFGRWAGFHLDAAQPFSLYIPPGFAHGFQAVTDAAVMYKVTAEYDPDRDRGILWSDPTLTVPWPCAEVIVSGKDRVHPLFANAEVFA